MTPKTLDKYIAALKKKAVAEGWSLSQYEAEVMKIQAEMQDQYAAGKITDAEAQKVSKQIVNALKNPGMQGKKQASAQTAKPAQLTIPTPTGPAMNNTQKAAVKYNIKQKFLKGEITQAEYDANVKHLDALYSAGVSLQDANQVFGLTKKTAGAKSAQAGNSQAAAQTAAQVQAPSPMTKKELDKLKHEVVTQVVNDQLTQKDGFKLMDLLNEFSAQGMSQEEAKKHLDNAFDLVNYKGLSVNDAIAATKQAVIAQTQAQQAKPATTAAQTAQPMTHDEYIGLWEELNKQKKAGKISEAEYQAKGQKLDQLKAQNASLETAKSAMGTDPGSKATTAADEKLAKELKKIYGEAQKELSAKLKEFTDQYGNDLQEKQAAVKNGEMTQAELQAWINGQHQMKKILEQKIDQCTGVLLDANQKAMGMINGETLHVFAENANYQSWQLTQDTKVDLMFSVYDEKTVKRLIREKPELLPRKVVNGKKDKAWNQKILANAVTQAIIQGESIPKLAGRIAAQTGETNKKAMLRYARTAMTSAQNGGRMEMLHMAKDMGIKVKKTWLATLDGRTRDVHAKLDGQTVDIDEPFHSELGDIMFPGDNGSKGSVPANLYNCRCTLVYEYEDFPNDPTDNMRRDNETGQLITDMDYGEWKAAKEGSVLNDLNAAKINLAEAQKALVKANVKEDKVYEGIWKDPVTLADYPDKKDAIQAKRDYYTAEIEKYNQAKAEGKSWATDDKISELVKKRKLLDEFEKRGQLLQKRNEALKKVQDLYDQVGYAQTAAAPAVAKKAPAKKAKKTAKKAAAASGGANTGAKAQTGAGLSLGAIGEKKTPFGPEAYTQERKDKAVWSKTPREADGHLRDVSGEVWNKATKPEKTAIIDYTQSYSKFNEPLRGIEYGTSRYLGVGNTDLNAGHKRNGSQLNAMTDLISRSTYAEDIWLQRGCRYENMDKFFNIPMSLLEHGSQKELEQAILGTTPIEYGFMSCGSNKGSGLNVHQSGGVLLNIYCPSGTQMMYVEPFSHYGGHDYDWDGKRKQTSFGSEVETLVNQGTQFRVTKVERSGRTGKIYVDMEVINQDHQQRWKP